MRVKMAQQISGLLNGEPWPAPGETVDLPDDEVTRLVANGMAETSGKKSADAAEKEA